MSPLHAVCLTPGSCALAAVDTIWGSLADAIRGAVGDMVTTLFGWWTTTGSLDLTQPLVANAQHYVTAWVAVPVAVLAVMAAVSWGVLSGSVSWVSDLFRGLLIFGIVAAGSIPIIIALQDWSTALAAGLLAAVPTQDVGQRIISLLSISSGTPALTPMLVIVWGFILLIVSTLQYLEMLFRDGVILVITAVLPVAAAGQFNRGSILWLPRLTGWLLAFVFLKPAAALIYYLGLTLIGQGQGIQALATATCMMTTAIFALPALVQLVTFATTPPPSGATAAGNASTAAGLATAAAQIIR